MSEQCQPIFSSRRVTVKPGVPVSTTSRRRRRARGSPVRTAVVTKSARARGDEGLGAVDDVLVAVAAGGRAQFGHIGATVGLGHRERPDQLTCQRRPHVPVDQVAGRRRRDVRQGDAGVNSAAMRPDEPPARISSSVTVARVDQRAARRRRPPRRSRRPAGRPRRPCGAPRAAPRRPAPTRRGAARPPARRTDVAQSPAARAFVSVGSQQCLRDVDDAGAQPLAERLGLRVEPGGRRDALAEQPVDHEVDRAQVRQGVPVDRQRGASGSSPRQLARRSGARGARRSPASVRAQTPRFASPPLSPERAPTTVPSGARRVGPPRRSVGAVGRISGAVPAGRVGGIDRDPASPSGRTATCGTSAWGTYSAL